MSQHLVADSFPHAAYHSFLNLFLLRSYRMLFPETQRLRMTEKLLWRADVDPTLRPTDISVSQFRALADAYSGLCRENHELFSYEYREELRQKRQSRRQAKRETR